MGSANAAKADETVIATRIPYSEVAVLDAAVRVSGCGNRAEFLRQALRRHVAGVLTENRRSA